MHASWALAASACLLIAGCSDTGDGEGGPSATTSGSMSLTGTNAMPLNDTADAPPTVLFNESYDFFVTFASAGGVGSNFLQENCVHFEPIRMLNGTATATWTADATSQQMALVVTDYTGPANAMRKEGTSPLTVAFTAAGGAADFAVSVQAPAMAGAVQQVPVELVVSFEHDAGEEPAPQTATCAL